jgi:hypothetical protein
MIERVKKGESPSLVDTNKANELIDAINSIMNSKGAGGIKVRPNQSGQLTIFPSGADTAQPTYHPFEIIGISEKFISINAGTINNELVVPVGGINHDATDSLRFLYIDINAGEDGINSAEYKVKGSAPDGFEFKENNIPPRMEILIAVIKNLSWEQVVHTNLNANIVRAYENPKQSVSIGEYDNDIWWRWYVTRG